MSTIPPTDPSDNPAMIGPSPSERGLPSVPKDIADHAEDFAHRYEVPLDHYCALRMQELGIPEHLQGATDFDGDGRWKAFIARERQGGNITDGISVNSGCLNYKLLKGKGSRLWAKAKLPDRIDAIIAHEYQEDRLGRHDLALKQGGKTELPIRDGARRILKAMGR
jgi:hypothetical protein